jgi:hypothetical protein
MKKLIISIITISILLFSCKTTKIDSSGNKVLTANTRHMNRIHPHGFYAGGKLITPVKNDLISRKSN